MSNERIDQILEEVIPFFKVNENMNPHYAGLIRKSMEQYGKEQYVTGRKYGAETANERYGKEISRLRELVQAQKELIDLYDGDNLSDPAWLKETELRNQIKELEK